LRGDLVLQVLLLSQWYIPEPSTAHVLGKDLVAHGHLVSAITGFPNYPSGKIYAGYRIRWRQWEQIDGVHVLRLPLYPDHSRSAVRRALNYTSFATSVSLLGPGLCDSADVMWVNGSPTIGIPAWWISLLRRIPFVYNIQDMWGETVRASGMVRDGLAVRLLQELERFTYHRAAAITVVSPGFKRYLIDRGIPRGKIHTIPNWGNEEIYRPICRDPDFGQLYGLADHFNVIFAGNIGPQQALGVVLQAACLLREMPDIQFVLIGEGIDLPVLKAAVERQGLSNVRFIAQQPETEMPRFFAWADGLLVHLRNDPLYQITIPSKVLNYMACGHPILCAVVGDGAEVVRAAGAGLLCPPEDPQALAQAVRTLYTMPAAQREALGEAGRESFLQNYTRRVVVERQMQVLQEVAARRRR
jgi:glycosyltransferase involved in cell wall biosynthesis